MKVKELKRMIGESVAKVVKEAALMPQAESAMEPTDPSWFDTLAAPEDPDRELNGSPTSRKLVDLMKQELSKFGSSISKGMLNDLAQEFEEKHQLPPGIGWEVAHAAIEELRSKSLMEKKTKMKPEAFVEMVRGMIREEVAAVKKGK